MFVKSVAGGGIILTFFLLRFVRGTTHKSDHPAGETAKRTVEHTVGSTGHRGITAERAENSDFIELLLELVGKAYNRARLEARQWESNTGCPDTWGRPRPAAVSDDETRIAGMVVPQCPRAYGMYSLRLVYERIGEGVVIGDMIHFLLDGNSPTLSLLSSLNFRLASERAR